jgi:Transposase DDE domain group 1
VTLDIDDTVDVVHGHQQLSLFNAHYDERCFLPIHVYDTATSGPVAVLLRPGKTPSGIEVRGHLRRLLRRLRKHWPATRITIRGDGHYGRPEVMEWCDENGVDFIFGLPGNAVLDRLVDETADDIRTRRTLDQEPCQRGFAEISYRAKTWNTDRRACARIEATTKGLDIRFVVTSIETGSVSMPGVQNPHCNAWCLRNVVCRGVKPYSCDRPSTVTTLCCTDQHNSTPSFLPIVWVSSFGP